MASGCRDCSRCTETAAKGCVAALPRIVWELLTFWNIGLFVKKCPVCKHPMRLHARRADGSFKD